MTEKELIAQLREFRQIKPNQDWVLLTKNNILEGTRRDRVSVSFGEILEGIRIILKHKYAFSSALFILILLGVFGFSQNSLPGDSLYPIKKMAENSQAVFFSERGQIFRNFDLANKRLNDLTKAVEQNSVRNLGPAINEFQTSVSKAVESLGQAEKNPQAIKEIAVEVKKLEDKTKEVKSLGVEVGETGQLQKALAQLVEEQIKDLEAKTLTEEDQKVLEQAKDSYAEGDYSQALEDILLLSQ